MTDFEQFGDTDSCPECVNARSGRKQAVDHLEQFRFRMEVLLETTTEGDMRLERYRTLCPTCRGTECDGVSAQEASP